MSFKPLTKRFKNVNTVRQFVGRRLKEIELLLQTEPGNLEAHRVAFLGARLMGELIARADVEERLKRLEKTNYGATGAAVEVTQ